MLIPRDYQLEVDNSIWRYFETHKEGNPCIGMPTGTGKAFVIAYFLYKALRAYSNQKILVATHVKELVGQNYLEFLDLWPTAPAGIYSAGLGKKDTHQNIIFCGIASIVKNIEAFGRVDLMIVDECHLISLNEESMYMRVIKLLKERNPNLRVIGLTATPWRQGQGRLTDGGGLFTDMCIDLTDMQSFNRFVKEGYLVPLVSKPTQLLLDTTGVKLIGGEFNEKQLDLAVNKDHITYAALQETMQYAQDRRSWIVFATSIDHALKIEQMLQYLGVSCRVVHSKMPKGERDKNIQDWKDLKFTAIINMGILTTGINHPALDLIVMLRPTMSTVLWVQMLGRGTRPLFIKEGFNLTTIQGRLDSIAASAKQYCLVMDFAGNIKRLGPVNDPVLPRKKGAATGEVPVKICDICGNYNHISARYCGGEPWKTVEGCGAEFSFRVQIKQQASTEAVMKTDMPIIEDFKVSTLTCSIHQKANKPDSVKVTYYCLNRKFSEYLLIEHGPYFRQRAESWWKRRSRIPLPNTSAEAVELVPTFEIPTHIRVWTNTAFPKVMDECFMGEFANNLPINDDDIPF
jgi:DNA repair protein RadD